MKSFVAEDKAALAVTIALLRRVFVVFAAVKHVLPLLTPAGALLTWPTEASILSNRWSRGEVACEVTAPTQRELPQPSFADHPSLCHPSTYMSLEIRGQFQSPARVLTA